jgi:hypothetical protein
MLKVMVDCRQKFNLDFLCNKQLEVSILRPGYGWLPFKANISLVKEQFIVTHTVLQNRALLDSWITNAPSIKIWHPETKLLRLTIFVKT